MLISNLPSPLLLLLLLGAVHVEGGLDLEALLDRGARQLSDGEGGIALGLVSALQKWANSIGTYVHCICLAIFMSAHFT